MPLQLYIATRKGIWIATAGADRRSWAGIGYDGPFMPALVPESIAAYPDYDERGA